MGNISFVPENNLVLQELSGNDTTSRFKEQYNYE